MAYNYSPYQFQQPQYQYCPQQPQYIQQPQPQSRTPFLQGEMVDSIDVVRATNVDLSGNVTYYPKADLSEIYTKQLCADGTSRILTYVLTKPEQAKPEQQPVFDTNALNTMFQQFKTEIISEIQNMIPQIKGGSEQ